MYRDEKVRDFATSIVLQSFKEYKKVLESYGRGCDKVIPAYDTNQRDIGMVMRDYESIFNDTWCETLCPQDAYIIMQKTLRQLKSKAEKSRAIIKAKKEQLALKKLISEVYDGKRVPRKRKTRLG